MNENMCTAHLHVCKVKADTYVRRTVIAPLSESRTAIYNKAVNMCNVLRLTYSTRASCGLPWS
jgi:hypothetical protein